MFIKIRNSFVCLENILRIYYYEEVHKKEVNHKIKVYFKDCEYTWFECSFENYGEAMKELKRIEKQLGYK